MAFGKRRRRRFRRKKFKRKFKRRFKLRKGPMAFRMVRALKRKLGKIEEKFIEFSATNQLVGFGLSVFGRGFALIAQGNDDNQRIGSKISMQRIVWRANVTPSSLQSTPVVVRYMLVKFLYNTGTVIPSIGSILTFTATAPESVISLYHKQVTPGIQPFRVLMDRTFQMNFSGTSPSKKINFVWRFRKPNVVTYSGLTGSITDLAKGFIALYVFSDTPSIGVPTMNFNYRMYYTDN